MSSIGLDLDGVCFDFAASLRAYLVKRHNWDPSHCTDPQEWHFYRDWGLSDQGFVAMCHRAADLGELWDGPCILNPIDIDALHNLRDNGHTIHIITDRSFGTHPGASHQATGRWLQRNKIPYDTLTFAPDKTIVRTDYMIDDKIENVDALFRSGCTPYLLRRPWNDDPDEEENCYTRRRVESVAEFADIIIRQKAVAA